jgi:hypothetical protein
MGNWSYASDDANDNQIARVIGADTFNLGYDAENRLVRVQKNGVTIATFTPSCSRRAGFDADGKRVRSVVGSEVASLPQTRSGSVVDKKV